MQCSESEAVVHDLNRAGVLDLATRGAVIAHAQTCARCEALREAADALTAELYTLAMAEQQHEAPARVEASLVETFRANQQRARGVWLAPAWAWGLAAAAVLALGLATWVLRSPHRPKSAPMVADKANPASSVSSAMDRPAKGPEEKMVTAEKAGAQAQQADSFLPLPYSLPLGDGDDSVVVRVRMPRGALGAFGLPVNEETATEMIQVDFLLAEDGSPEAVRISR